MFNCIAPLQGVFSEIHGCVSTGKEANVYHAMRSAADSTFLVQGQEGGKGAADSNHSTLQLTGAEVEVQKESHLAVKVRLPSMGPCAAL